jgi:MFS transporter, DHA1 family, solute carrier family 18 (vesicular amine transporter), member 1/2
VMHPVYGEMVNRVGSRRLTMIGLVLVACLLPLLSVATSYRSAIGVYVIVAAAISMIITPSLAYMAEATSSAGAGSYGVGYGLYNMAWGAGLLGGPALSGFMFERMGFGWLMLMWAPLLTVVTWLLGRVQSPLPPTEELA